MTRERAGNRRLPSPPLPGPRPDADPTAEPDADAGGSESQRPRSRPISSFMISFEPAQIFDTRASRQARATRYSFM